MAMSPDFRDYILDQLDPIGAVSAKRMFGGGGIFLHGSMFALIADDVVYFKVDDGNAALYDETDASPFTYMRKEQQLALSYREVPADVIDDADELCRWAERAWEAAQRSKPSAKKKRKTGK